MIYPGPMCGDRMQYEIEHANIPLKERSDWPLPSFDARDWAKEFCKHFIIMRRDGYNTRPEDDEIGLMISWFANALMRGYDEGRFR